jgi:sarcosine oxidase
MSVERYDVVVIGAGAMGSATARALAAAGRHVSVLEQYDLGHDLGASHGGSRLFRRAIDNLDYSLRVERARRLWAEIEDEADTRLLEITGGLDHGVAERAAVSFGELFRSQGFAHQILDHEEATERWPGMRFSTPVLYQPDAGRLLADRAVDTFQRLARKHGAEFHARTQVHGLRTRPDDTIEINTTRGIFRADQTVLTCGAWAPKLLRDVLALPPMAITQEQPRFFAPSDPALNWPTFVHWRHGPTPLAAAEAYGVLEVGSGVKVGLHATGPEVDPDERDHRPEPRADEALLRYVEGWLPGLDPSDSTSISCLYANTADERFVIDRVGPISIATGFCGQGFKFVPLVAHYLAELVSGTGGPPREFRLAPSRR